MSATLTRPRDIARFWSVVKVPPRAHLDGCWEWTAGTDAKGYGNFYLDGRLRRATHLSWSFFSGEPFPKDMFACHRCDNPTCVNPEHLFVGTAADNSADMVAKGRSRKREAPRLDL
jgi:hypothetical protein